MGSSVSYWLTVCLVQLIRILCILCQLRCILKPVMMSVGADVYLQDLRTVLTDMQVGCYIDTTCVTHFSYADDVYLLPP